MKTTLTITATLAMLIGLNSVQAQEYGSFEHQLARAKIKNKQADINNIRYEITKLNMQCEHLEQQLLARANKADNSEQITEFTKQLAYLTGEMDGAVKKYEEMKVELDELRGTTQDSLKSDSAEQTRQKHLESAVHHLRLAGMNELAKQISEHSEELKQRSSQIKQLRKPSHQSTIKTDNGSDDAKNHLKSSKQSANQPKPKLSLETDNSRITWHIEPTRKHQSVEQPKLKKLNTRNLKRPFPKAQQVQSESTKLESESDNLKSVISELRREIEQLRKDVAKIKEQNRQRD